MYEEYAAWNGITVEVTDVRDTATGMCTTVELTNTATGAHGAFRMNHGSGFNVTTKSAISHLSAYPQYAFVDGYVEHGLEPYCEAVGERIDGSIAGFNPWCESLGKDPEDRATLIAYTEWVQAAFEVARILGDLVHDAYNIGTEDDPTRELR